MSSASSPLYELDRVLGTGATGVVWHGVLHAPCGGLPAGAEVAVKLLRPELADSAAARAAFEREARAGTEVRHPGLVRVLTLEPGGEGPRTIMNYVPGDTLRAVLAATGALPEPQVRAIGARLAGALAALHATGWIHGDLKPENARLDGDGGAVLVDLGFARHASEEPSTAGSPAYLAPEVAAGRPPSPASDVFALGVVLYELATGAHPFLGSAWSEESGGRVPDKDDALGALRRARYRPPSRLRPQLSPFLDALLAEVLERAPTRRPDAAELTRRLAAQESSAWWRRRLGGRRGSDPTGARAPIVGRDRELAELDAAWRAIVRRDEPTPPDEAGGVARREREERGVAVWITGAAGSGKSRLVHEFVRCAREGPDPPMFLHGRCPERLEARPAQPVLRLLTRYLWLPPETAPGERERAELTALVAPGAAATLLSALDPHFIGATAQSVQAALAAWLAALGRRTPLVVFLDDVHRAGPDTLDVLVRLADEPASGRLLLVLGQRDHEPPREPAMLDALRGRFARRDALRELALRPLTEPDVRALVDALFHPSAPRLRLAQVLWRRSRGNAGLFSELLRGMRARGDARPAPGADERGPLVLTVAPDELPLPSSLAETIRAAYRALPAPDRLWLRRLAVLGGRIREPFLHRVFPESSPAKIADSLRRLVRDGWLEPAGDRYRFARPALREAVYRSLGKTTRERLHAAAAEALRGPAGTPVSLEDAFQRAYHLRAAGDHAALLRLIEPLLSRLLDRGLPRRVQLLAGWGLEAIATLSPSRELARGRIAFLEAAADAADRLGDRARQREMLDALTDLDLDVDRDAELLGRVYLLHGRYAVSVGQYGLARGLLRNAAELCKRAGARRDASEALRRLALVQVHAGELASAREIAAQADALAVDDRARALLRVVEGHVDLLEGDIEAALRAAERAVALLRRSASRAGLVGVAAAHLLRARTYRAGGRPRRALASAQHALRAARQAGERRLEAEAGARLGGLLLDVDRPREAQERLREALLLAEEIEDRRGRVLAGLFLGVLLGETGDAEAETLLARTAALAAETGLARAEAVACAILARVHREGGDRAAAEALARRALELVLQHGAETADRVVIEGTWALLGYERGDEEESRRRVKALRRDLRKQNAALHNPTLKRRHRVASTRLLAAVLSPEGPVYPRVRLPANVAPEP